MDETQSNKIKPKCPRCGATMYENVTSCLQCGFSISDKEEVPQNSQQTISEKIKSTENTVSLSFRLFKESVSVLVANKSIIIFPILVFTISLVIIFAIFHNMDFSKEIGHDKEPSANFVWSFYSAYFLIVFVSIFGKAGIVAMSYEYMMGGKPTFESGLNKIIKNFEQIFAWAFFASTIGLFIEMLKNKSNKNAITRYLIGTFMGYVEIAWHLVSFAVLPIVTIEEKVGLKESVDKSATLLNDTWGESLVGRLSMDFLTNIILFSIPTILFTVVGICRITDFFMAMFITFASVIAIILINISLNSIYATALYVYATKKVVPPGYSEDLMKNAYQKSS